MCDKKGTATQIRLSASIYTQVKQLSENTGDSINGTMLNLIYWGLKAYNSDIILQIQKE